MARWRPVRFGPLVICLLPGTKGWAAAQNEEVLTVPRDGSVQTDFVLGIVNPPQS